MLYPLQEEMYKKDAELYASVHLMNPWAATCKWREKYPEDLEGVWEGSPLHETFQSPWLIKPRS